MEAIEKQLGELKTHVNTLIEKANNEVLEKTNGRVEKETKAALDAALKKYNDLEKQTGEKIDKLDAAFQKAMESGEKETKSFSEQFAAKAEEIKLAEKFNAGRNVNMEFPELTGKAVGTMTEADSLTGEVIAPTRREGIIELAQRQLHVRSLLPAGTMTSNLFRYQQETAGEGGADVTGEGDKKNQIDFDLAAKDAAVKKITGFVDISEELLEDLSAMQSFLGRRLQKEIRKKEDAQFLYGSGTTINLTGLNDDPTTFAAVAADSNATIIDLVIQALAQQEGLEHMPNGLLLHPREYYSIYLAKASGGEFLKQELVTVQNGQLFIAGMPVFRTTAVTQGEYFLGDWSEGAQIMDRKGLNVRFYDQNNDNAEKNLITVVAEERLAFPIFYPKAFTYGTVATDVAKIKNFS